MLPTLVGESLRRGVKERTQSIVGCYWMALIMHGGMKSYTGAAAGARFMWRRIGLGRMIATSPSGGGSRAVCRPHRTLGSGRRWCRDCRRCRVTVTRHGSVGSIRTPPCRRAGLRDDEHAVRFVEVIADGPNSTHASATNANSPSTDHSATPTTPTRTSPGSNATSPRRAASSTPSSATSGISPPTPRSGHCPPASGPRTRPVAPATTAGVNSSSRRPGSQPSVLTSRRTPDWTLTSDISANSTSIATAVRASAAEPTTLTNTDQHPPTRQDHEFKSAHDKLSRADRTKPFAQVEATGTRSSYEVVENEKLRPSKSGTSRP
jgi:hypothetical protein